MAFSPQQALDYARTVAIPRRLGSEGEQVIATGIINRLMGFGYHVEQQPFQFIAALHGWIRLELVAGSLLILAMMTMRAISPWAPTLPAILLLSLIFLVNSLHRWVQSSSLLQGDRSTFPLKVRILYLLGPHFTSTNIVASSPDYSSDDADPHLYLMAHYDSKSQTLPLPIRMTLFTLYILGGFSTSIMTILSLLLPGLDTYIPYFAWGSLLFGIPLIYMGVGNNSPGAIDNASGVGLILHLAELISADKDLHQGLRVTFLFTSAEEEGLMGAMAYVTINEAVLRGQAQKGGIYFLNFDGVGTQGKLLLDETSKRPKESLGGSLGDLLRETCSELEIPISRFPPIGALMDHAPFADHGFEAISLATAGRAAWSVHTRHDTVNKFHSSGFERAGCVALRMIQRLTYKGIRSGPLGEEKLTEPDQVASPQRNMPSK
jgi:hypothetical protein